MELDLAVSKPGDGDGFDGTELFCGAGDACGFAPLFAYSEPVRAAETTKKPISVMIHHVFSHITTNSNVPPSFNLCCANCEYVTRLLPPEPEVLCGKGTPIGGVNEFGVYIKYRINGSDML